MESVVGMGGGGPGGGFVLSVLSENGQKGYSLDSEPLQCLQRVQCRIFPGIIQKDRGKVKKTIRSL